MRRKDLIDIEGGIAYTKDFPSYFPKEILIFVEQFVKDLNLDDGTKWMYREGERERNLDIILTNSFSISAKVYSLKNTDYILLPKGLCIRLYLLIRSLFSYRHKETTVRIVAPIVESYENFSLYIPGALRAIFLEYDSDSALRKEWKKYYRSYKVNDDELLIILTTVMAIVNILLHEMAHVFMRHKAFLDYYQSTGGSDFVLTANQIRRSLEVHADMFAGQKIGIFAYNLLSTFSPHLSTPDQFRHTFEAISYCLTYGSLVSYGMMDVNNRGLNSYKNNLYPHPTVRHTLQAIETSLYVKKRFNTLSSNWNVYTHNVEQECGKCFHWLVLDKLMSGKKPEISLIKKGQRLSGLLTVEFGISGDANNQIKQQIEEERRCVQVVLKYLNEFLKK